MAEDLDKLIMAAKEARRFAINSDEGVAMRDSTGTVWRSSGITTADHIVGQCAERTALFYALSNGASEIEMVVIAYEENSAVHPCGACLEAFSRFAPNARIYLANADRVLGPYGIAELLPASVGPRS